MISECWNYVQVGWWALLVVAVLLLFSLLCGPSEGPYNQGDNYYQVIRSHDEYNRRQESVEREVEARRLRLEEAAAERQRVQERRNLQYDHISDRRIRRQAEIEKWERIASRKSPGPGLLRWRM